MATRHTHAKNRLLSKNESSTEIQYQNTTVVTLYIFSPRPATMTF